MVPSAATAASVIAVTWSSWVMSAVIGTSSWPAARASSTAASLASARLPAMATRAPASARPSANALPRPWLPPVTSAVLPSRRNGEVMP